MVKDCLVSILNPKVKDRVCGIYCIVNTVNGKKYIGKSKNIYNRIHQHKYDIINDRYRNENEYFRRSVKKYGIESFKYYVVEECSIEDTKERELHWIKTLGTINKDNGYNLRMDSSTGMVTSKETSLKISNRLKKEWAMGIRDGHSEKIRKAWAENPERVKEQSKMFTRYKTKYSYILEKDSIKECGITYKNLKDRGLSNVLAEFSRRKTDKAIFKGYIITRVKIKEK